MDGLPNFRRSFAKNNLRIQKGRVGFFLYVQLTFLDYFFIVPCKQQGYQVRIYNKSFGDFITIILADKGEINILNKPGLINEVYAPINVNPVGGGGESAGKGRGFDA